MNLYLLTTALFLLQLADWYTTVTVIKAGGYEQNPIMAKLFSLTNMNVILGLKAVLVTGLGYYAGTLMPIALAVLVVFYVGLIYHNAKSL